MKRQGTNEWTCPPGRVSAGLESCWPSVHVASPICADLEDEVIQAYVGGKTPKLERDTIIYTQAGDEGYDNTDPSVIEEKDAAGAVDRERRTRYAHAQGPQNREPISTPTSTGNPYVMFGGTPYAHLMIPTDGSYYQYQKGR